MTSSVLFTPVGINRMTLKNRIVMPAMASYHAAVNGEATEKLIRYHEERAKGGVGMNIVEATYVARSGNSFDLGLGISDDFMIKGLSKLTDAVHRHDGKIAIQLQHGGRFGNPPTSGCPRLLVSMIPGLAPTENARVMDADDIEGMVEAYVQAARRAVEAGFDAVEIHGAHGYLINQFMSPRPTSARMPTAAALKTGCASLSKSCAPSENRSAPISPSFSATAWKNSCPAASTWNRPSASPRSWPTTAWTC